MALGIARDLSPSWPKSPKENGLHPYVFDALLPRAQARLGGFQREGRSGISHVDEELLASQGARTFRRVSLGVVRL